MDNRDTSMSMKEEVVAAIVIGIFMIIIIIPVLMCIDDMQPTPKVPECSCKCDCGNGCEKYGVIDEPRGCAMQMQRNGFYK